MLHMSLTPYDSDSIFKNSWLMPKLCAQSYYLRVWVWVCILWYFLRSWWILGWDDFTAFKCGSSCTTNIFLSNPSTLLPGYDSLALYIISFGSIYIQPRRINSYTSVFLHFYSSLLCCLICTFISRHDALTLRLLHRIGESKAGKLDPSFYSYGTGSETYKFGI